MDGLESVNALPVVIGTVVAGLLLVVVFFCRRGSSASDAGESEGQAPPPAKAVPEVQASKKKAVKARKPSVAGHRLLAADVKGHTSTILSVAFDPSGDYLVSSSAGQ